MKKPSSAPLQWGDVGFRPHLFYRLTYGDGVQSQPGQQTTTTINSISPGVAMDLGSRWTADYTPTWTFYSSRVFHDTVAHAAELRGGAAFTDGNLQFAQTYSLSNDPLIETGQQTRQETAGTSLSVTYSLGRHSRIDASVGQDLRFADNSPTSRTWSTNEWLHYQFTNRLDAAVGVGLGYVSVDPGSDMRFSQPQVRIGWRPVDKLSFDVHAGREHRTFSKSGAAPLNSPTFGASVQYQPIDVTTISFTAERGVTASYFANEVTEGTNWTLAFSQRLLQRLNLSGGYGRSKTRYIPIASMIVVGRDDESENFNLRLGTGFLRRGSIGLVYQHTRNLSNAAGFGFNSNQTGLEVSYRY